MPDSDFSTIRAVIGEADPLVQESARAALSELGFRDVRVMPTLVKLHHAIRRDAPDLVILNETMDGQETSFITGGIRTGKLGQNPFCVVIALISAMVPEKLRSIVDSGADDALLLPLASEALRKKVMALAGPRKPFVVTCDYVGPERRVSVREGRQSARQIEVPNPLAAGAGYAQARDIAAREIRAEWLTRLAAQIQWLADCVRAMAGGEESFLPQLHRIEAIGKELAARTGNPGQVEAINRLLRHYKAIKAAPLIAPPPDSIKGLVAEAAQVVEVGAFPS